MNWFESTEQFMTFEQEQARKFDYFKTFYGTEAARRVWAEVRQHIMSQEVTSPDSAIAKLAQIDLIESIKESCGISNQNSIVDAEMSTAAHLVEAKPPEKENLLDMK